MWWVIAGVVVLGAALWGPIASDVEQAAYQVVEAHANIEIRDYAPMIVAEAEVAGDREQAIGAGFRIIADYIFGNNAAARKVAMTAPVTQQGSAKIAMTAPVTQQLAGHGWKVRFVMPAGSTLATLPKPNNPAVRLLAIDGQRFAAIRFSGTAREEALERRAAELDSFVVERHLTTVSAPVFAFYNPPWTLPFLRRNEVMVEIAR